MSEPEKSRSTFKIILLVLAFCAINIAILSLQYVGEYAAFNRASSQLGLVAMGLCFGLIAAQNGCAVLWVCLSTCALPRRLLIYVAVLVQLTAVSMGSQALLLRSFANFEYMALNALNWMTMSGMVLVFTLIASRLAQRRMRFVEAERFAMGDSRSGATIFQLIYLMTLVAIMLTAYSYGRLGFTQASDHTWLGSTLYMCFYAIASSCLTSIVLLASLFIVVWFSRLWQQLMIGGLVGFVASYLTLKAFGSDGAQFAYMATWVFCMVIIPILWLAIVRRMGYVIRCFDRGPKQDVGHPLTEDNWSKEVGR